MKFGIQIEPQFGFAMSEIEEIAQVGLANGFNSVWFSDHFMLDAESIDRVLLDPWLVMTALACRNEKVRIGSLVFCNSYRAPALHAKMAATLDVISNGRLEFGIGAGWKKLEYDSYGIPFPDDMTRIGQLADAVQIIRGIWLNDKFDFAGEHYSVQGAISFPKPVQNPHPTIWIGTMYGRKHMISLCAKHADGINLAWTFSPDKLKSIFSALDNLRAKYHRGKPIRKSVGLWTNVFETTDEMDAALQSRADARGMKIERVREQVSAALWGTPEEIEEKLKNYYDLGVEFAILMFPHHKEIEQIRRISQVIL